MATADVATPLDPPARGRRAVQAVVLAVIASAGASLAIEAIARSGGADLMVPGSPGSNTVEFLEPAPVLVASIVPMLPAAALALGLRRWAPHRGPAIFTTAVLVGLVGSFLPFVTEDFSAGTTVALAVMHPTSAICAVVLPAPFGRQHHGLSRPVCR